MTVVVFSSTRELSGTPAVVRASPFGQIVMVFAPAAFATVSVSVEPAGIVRSVPFGSVKLVSVGTPTLLLGVAESVWVMLRPPALEVSVTTTLRAPVPPLRDSHRRTGTLPTGSVSAWRSAGVITQVSDAPPFTVSFVSATLGKVRDIERTLAASRRR